MPESTDNVTESTEIVQARTDTMAQMTTPETTEQVEAIAQILHFDDLTPCRRKLLVVNYDPGLALKSITDRCILAGVGRRSYYTALGNPAYLAACRKMTQLAWNAVQPEMQARYVKLAQSSKPGSERALERILEQTESLREKAGPSVNVNVTLTASELADRRHQNQAEGLALLGVEVPKYLTGGDVVDTAKPQDSKPLDGVSKPSGGNSRHRTMTIIDDPNPNADADGDHVQEPAPEATPTRTNPEVPKDDEF